MSVYNKGGGGYGITGSFNVYTTKTHVGNWREDVIGTELAANPRAAVGMYETAARSDWIDPKLMVARTGPNHAKFASSVRFLSKEEMKQKNKEGLSYPLLFQHGMRGEDITPGERYQSQLTLSFSDAKLKTATSSSSSSGGGGGGHKGHSNQDHEEKVELTAEVRRQREKAKEIKKDIDAVFNRGTSEAKAANAYATHVDTLAPRAVEAGASADLPNFRRRAIIARGGPAIKYR
jgi:hypothetical protein